MNITKEKLVADLAAAQANRDKLLHQLNAQTGYVQALTELIAHLDAPEPKAKEADAEPV